MNRLRIVFKEPTPDGRYDKEYRTPINIPASPVDAKEMIRRLNQIEENPSEVAIGFPILGGFVMYPAGVIHHIELLKAEDEPGQE